LTVQKKAVNYRLLGYSIADDAWHDLLNGFEKQAHGLGLDSGIAWRAAWALAHLS